MKIKIGIPRGFLYYRDYILFKNFLRGLVAPFYLVPLVTEVLLKMVKNWLLMRAVFLLRFIWDMLNI